MTTLVKQVDLQHFEITQLLEAIYFRYGYDFRHYARASLERKVINRLRLAKLVNISAMTCKILYEPSFFNLFLKDMSVTVTEMFRDPYVFKKIRTSVCQHLKTYSRVNIWHVGCATGEEAYSMAILLDEEGLLPRTRIYATDYNNHSLELATRGNYKADKMPQYNENYLKSGGKSSLSHYYQQQGNIINFDDSLKKYITFANHNLMKDQVFAQMHLVFCRNVLIYFDATLQNSVLNLLKESLIHRGFLILGDKESLDFSQQREYFENYANKERIYRLCANL